MLTLLPLLLGPQNADPLTLLRTTLASPQTLQTVVTRDGVSGTLTVAPDGSVLVVAGPERLVHNAEANWEFDSDLRLYDRLPPLGPLLGGAVGTGRLSARASGMLVPFLVTRGQDGALKTLFQREGARYTRRQASTTFTLEFGKDRTLTRASYIGPMGGTLWTFSKLRLIPNDPKLFRASVPAGYAEAFEPGVPDSLRIGSELPSKFRDLAPQGAKTWLLAVLEKGVSPSEEARAWLNRLTQKIPNAILDAASTEDRKALAAPDSPTYLLISDGKVLGVWIGYEPREEARMEAEMQSAIEEAGSSA